MENMISSLDCLNDDCLEMIFARLRTEEDLSDWDLPRNNENDFESLSLVCKRFLAISNRMKTKLKVTDVTAYHFPRVLLRFRNLKSIEIDTKFHKDVNNLVVQISQSSLEHLEALEVSCEGNIYPREGLCQLSMCAKGLKKLICYGYSWSDKDLVWLADLFPTLEEVGYWSSNEITDYGIGVLASRLNRLKAISFCNCDGITDEAIMLLSSNCKELTDIYINSCSCVTENGVGFLMRHSSKLASLALSYVYSNDEDASFSLINSISYARNLKNIELINMRTISDEFLHSIAKLRLSLTNMVLFPPCDSFEDTLSMQGVAALLRACSCLKRITLEPPTPTYESILGICEHLKGLTCIKLWDNYSVPSAIFFLLTKNCPLLESITIDFTETGPHENLDLVSCRNNRVKNLKLRMVGPQNDKILRDFCYVCPSLEYLDLCGCKFSNDGISEIVSLCSELRHLDICWMEVSNFLGPRKEKSKLKLKKIVAYSTQIDDSIMKLIGKRCPELEVLFVGGCYGVTSHGVELVLSKCHKLRFINMFECKNVSIDILDGILVSRPSLRKIVPPRGFIPTEEKRNYFLENGCLLLNGDDPADR